MQTILKKNKKFIIFLFNNFINNLELQRNLVAKL